MNRGAGSSQPSCPFSCTSGGTIVVRCNDPNCDIGKYTSNPFVQQVVKYVDDPWTSIVLNIVKNSPNVLFDTYVNDQVDIADMQQLPSNPQRAKQQGKPNAMTQAENWIHLLEERKTTPTSDRTDNGPGNTYIPDHLRATVAHNAYRMANGQFPQIGEGYASSPNEAIFIYGPILGSNVPGIPVIVFTTSATDATINMQAQHRP